MLDLGIFEKLLHYAYLIPSFPFLAFLIISLITLRNGKISSLISILSIFSSFLISLGIFLNFLFNSYHPPFELETNWILIDSFKINLGLLIDHLSSMMLLVVSLIAFLIQIYSLGYMEEEKSASFSRYFAYMSLFVSSMLALVLANNFVQTYIFWELVGLCSYLLIGFWYQKPSAAQAAKKAFIVTRFGDLGFLIGIIYLNINTNTVNFLQLELLAPDLKISLLTISALLIFCGAVGKSAQFPLHIWLPDAMEGPTPVSALIHAATMVAAGVYLVARAYPIFHLSSTALLVVAVIGALTAFIAASIAIAQNDIKKILAYSTISQLGYMMLALGVGGYSAGTFHLITHAFFKALLFLGAGSVIHAIHTNNIWEMGGLGKKMPITGLTFLIGCLAIAGIPPFSGFFSKDEILNAVWNFQFLNFPILALILKITAFLVVFLTAFYMFRLYYLTFSGNFRGKQPARENRLVMTIPLAILALFALSIGWIGTPFKNYYEKFIYFEGAFKAHEIGSIGELLTNIPVLISLTLAILGILSAYIIYKKQVIQEENLRKRFSTIYKCLENKYWIDEFWMILVKYGLFLISKISAFIDEFIIDGAVRGVGSLTYSAGVNIASEHTGKVQRYALVFIAGLTLLLIGMIIFYSFGMIGVK